MSRWEGRFTLHHCLRTGIREKPRHMGDVWQDFAGAMGVPRTSSKPELFLTEEENAKAALRIATELPGKLPLIIIHPFHGGNTCHPALKDYAEVARLLQKSGRCRILITGVAKERDSWLRVAGGLQPENLWVACGELTLRELFAVIGQAHWIVCGGTGTLHVAAALNVPAISILCPHPVINEKVWGNPVPGTVVLSPPPSGCPNLNGGKLKDCGFRNGPTPSAIADAVLAQLSPEN
jgi:ADP-heptose:LPS heptosyltransferase